MLFFICRYYLLKSSIKRSSKDLSDIHKHLLDNRIVTLSSPNKSLEDLLFHMNQTLEVIRTSYQEFEKKEIALKEQIENISHDLRTPLAVIRGYIKLLNKEANINLSADEIDILHTIDCKSEKMEALIHEFYTFSKISSTDYKINLEPVDICRSLKESIMDNYSILESSNLQITAKIPDYPLSILGNKEALDRIFNNFFQNACRYALSYFEISLEKSNNEVTVRFTNDSSKLTTKDIPHLFERFYVSDSSRNGDGTGLGLIIAKHLVESMNGSIKVTHTENSSSILDISFHMNLPCF